MFYKYFHCYRYVLQIFLLLHICSTNISTVIVLQILLLLHICTKNISTGTDIFCKYFHCYRYVLQIFLLLQIFSTKISTVTDMFDKHSSVTDMFFKYFTDISLPHFDQILHDIFVVLYSLTKFCINVSTNRSSRSFDVLL